ncbi:hypothetical protein TVAG_241510 [Trichomonas vaginalis G3]|uniref:Bap-like n=1 Tax=Trichomonas vaginalis (strain ATCC PRA-98 / G3) TaxID=412133 RepID=A2FKZ9_TRIV3|nr:hypothetical protein TVAGG3_0846640 [Trichomonas vaginalis G3]EAX94415.1 hypothetical protein TVAG_241510 [Trichomonas vaginalis G3]KAI5499665.1 hypothetical protein TVAGG3_0846640 [Trichomonas vaginalis G3]|eukprot:XP_001307345.1 hypothetical protein [Trichomonas vaginalis G3]
MVFQSKSNKFNIKPYHNNNHKKNLLENKIIRFKAVSLKKYFFKYPATEPLKLSLTFENRQNRTVEIIPRYSPSDIQLENVSVSTDEVVDQLFDISHLPIGDYKFYFRVYTNNSYYFESFRSFSIGYSPKINVSDIEFSPLEVREDIDTRLNVSFVLSIPEKSGTNLQVNFYFNDNHGINSNEFAYFPRIYNYSINFSNIYYLDKKYLLDGINYVYFYPKQGDRCGEFVNASFKYIMKKPILNIITPDNQVFKKNDDTKFNLEETIKCDYECDNVSLFYQIDEYEVKTIVKNIPMQPDIAIEGNHGVEFPSDLTEGNNHSIRIWVTDGFNRTSMVTKNFSYLFDYPTIEVLPLSKDSYTDFADDIINVTGFVSHPYHTGQLSVFHRIDDKSEISATSSPIQVESSNEKHQFNFTFQIPSITEEGLHIITIWAQDERGVKSNIQNFIFGFEHNSPPEIVSFDISPLEFFKNGLTPMEINVRIGDINGAKNAVIMYKFEDGEYKNLKPIKIEQSSAKTKTMEIYVPNYLHEGNNTIYLIVSDGNKNSTEVNKTFEFKFNPPILNITTADNQVLWKNTSKEFHFVGNLKDDDANGNVTIFYQFDGEQPKQANTYNITDNKIHDISYNATFPSNFSENNHHRITIWAIDETNKISENYILHFSYLFNDPILNLISPDKQAFKKNI